MATMQQVAQPTVNLETAKQLRDQVQSLVLLAGIVFKKNKIAVIDSPGFPIAQSLREAQEMLDGTVWIEKLHRKLR
jgi:hypothetical protein